MNTVSRAFCLAAATSLAAPSLLVACSRTSREDAPSSGSAAVAAKVPAPPDLAGELVVANPERSLAALRRALGDEAVLVPRTVGGLAVSLLGLPLRAAQEFDEALPLVGALAGDEDARFAFAVHVRDGGTFAVVATSGEDAPFTVERVDGLAHLVPRASLRGPLVPGLALGVAGNYLVVGTSRDAVTTLGPYLAHMLGPRADRGEREVAFRATGQRFGKLAKRLLDGSTASLDPATWAALAPIVDLDATRDALTDSLARATSVDATLTLGEPPLRLEARVSLDESRRLAGRALVRPTELMSLRADSMLGLALGSDAAGRKAEASARQRGLVTALAAKGGRFDAAASEAALLAVAEGRGDVTRFGAVCSGAGLTGFATGSVTGREALERGLRGLVGLKDDPALKRALDGRGLDVTAERGRLELVTDEVTLIRVAPRPKKDATSDERRSAIDLRFTVGDERFVVAAGNETVDVLRGFYRPTQAGDLGKVEGVAAALARLGDESFAALYLDPAALRSCAAGRPSASPSGFMVAALSPSDGGVTLRVEVKNAVLAGLVATLR